MLLCATITLFFLSSTLFSQTVTVTAPVVKLATFCAGTNVTVNYTVTSFYRGNIFTTQLSMLQVVLFHPLI